jgi:hypothetical protein
MKFKKHRNEIERQIIVCLVEDLLAEGYRLGVNDGEETVLEASADEETIFGAMSTTDEDYLLFSYENTGGVGWIRLIYGNGPDVISDYTVTLKEKTLERASALADRFQSSVR